MNATVRPIRWWVRVYTGGLPAEVRERRRAEIESDLWDQVSDLCVGSAAAGGGAIWPIWMRWLAGVPDDLLWRLEQPRARRATRSSERRISMFDLRMDRLSVVPLIIVAAATVAALLIVVVDNIQYFEQSQRFVDSSTLVTLSGGLLIGGLVAIPIGFLLMSRSPAGGAVLAAGGAIVAAVVTYWLIVPLIVAALVAFVAVRHARRVAVEH